MATLPAENPGTEPEPQVLGIVRSPVFVGLVEQKTEVELATPAEETQ